MSNTDSTINAAPQSSHSCEGGNLKEKIGWETVIFTQVYDIQGGTQPPKSEFVYEPTDGYVRLLQIRDFGKKPVPTFVLKSKKLKTCKKQDLLIGRYGASLGRICTGMEGAYNVALAKVITPTNVCGGYTRRYLESRLFQDPLNLLSRSAQNGFNKDDLASFYVPLPPLAEQKIIADKLDELLAQVDTLKTRLDAIPAILKRFRQSVLAAAVNGKLTEEWRSKNKPIEPVNVESILTARKAMWAENEQHKMLTQGITATNEKWRKKYKEPDSVLEEDCFPIPEEWSWASLGQLTYSVKDGPHYSPKYADTGVPFISGGNITPEGINFSKTKFITHELNEELCKRCKPEVGDVLYTKGGTTGIAYFNQETAEFNVWVHVAVLKITNMIDGKYLQNSLNSKHCYSLAQRYTHGVGNQDLGLTRMIKITIPVPPIEEQTEIVRKVEQLFTYADQVEQQVKNAQTKVNQLTQSILAKAFRGELTEQWRQDNPELISGDNSAAALLERIKAERAAAAPPRKTKKQQTKVKL